MSTPPSALSGPLLPRMAPFDPLADRIGVDPDILRRDHECPPLVMIGGVSHADKAALLRFEHALFLRAWGAESQAHRAKVARRAECTEVA